MIILGIETSCDETAAAIVKDGTEILGHSVSSSLEIQKQYGGIVPEVAARHQLEYITPVLKDAFEKAQLTQDDIDAIAVTIGPGLMGSLLVGVETAKTLSYAWQKPLIPVNHLVGHIYSGWLDDSSWQKPEFPLLALIASGGHTDLVLMTDHGKLEKIGQTRDDAVGEAFDKVARVLGLEYPGGPIIEKKALDGDATAFDLPRPMIDSDSYDFSYSGLKTAVLYKVQELQKKSSREAPKAQVLSDHVINDLCASFQQAAFEPLIVKTLKAAKEHNVKSILVTGGVSANRRLAEMFTEERGEVSLHTPPLKLATDNATYIAGSAYFLRKKKLDPTNKNQLEQILKLKPNPNLGVEDAAFAVEL